MCVLNVRFSIQVFFWVISQIRLSQYSNGFPIWNVCAAYRHMFGWIYRWHKLEITSNMLSWYMQWIIFSLCNVFHSDFPYLFPQCERKSWLSFRLIVPRSFFPLYRTNRNWKAKVGRQWTANGGKNDCFSRVHNTLLSTIAMDNFEYQHYIGSILKTYWNVSDELRLEYKLGYKKGNIASFRLHVITSEWWKRVESICFVGQTSEK